MKFNNGWYAMYSKPRHEKKVHSQLRELKVDSFLPTVKVVRQWHDRKKLVDAPLFPSYVFVYLRSNHDYFDSLNVEGALYFVKTGKDVARIQDTVIDNLKTAVGAGDDVEVTDRYFEPGRQLVIKEGPLTGLSGEVIESASKKKLLIRVNLLHRCVTVSLPPEYVEPQ